LPQPTTPRQQRCKSISRSARFCPHKQIAMERQMRRPPTPKCKCRVSSYVAMWANVALGCPGTTVAMTPSDRFSFMFERRWENTSPVSGTNRRAVFLPFQRKKLLKCSTEISRRSLGLPPQALRRDRIFSQPENLRDGQKPVPDDHLGRKQCAGRLQHNRWRRLTQPIGMATKRVASSVFTRISTSCLP
jgi:hypothetical protein